MYWLQIDGILRSGLHNSIIISRSGLCLATVTVPIAICYSVCRKILPDVPTVSLPSIIYFNFRAYFTKPYMRYNMYSRPACKEGASKGGIFIRKYYESVLVLICKLANQWRQRLPIHRFYSHTGTQDSKIILLCSLDLV
jgi:hypothetical protein